MYSLLYAHRTVHLVRAIYTSSVYKCPTLVQRGVSYTTLQTILFTMGWMERVRLRLSCIHIVLYLPAAVVSLSGPGGSMLRTFDRSTGQLLLEKRLNKPHEDPHLHSGNIGNGTEIAFVDQSRDIVVLTSGHNVQRIG
jgi:hypothetical protein